MSTLKPLPKTSPTVARRVSATRQAEARRKRDRMRLLAAALAVVVVALIVAVVVRERANAPVAASSIPVPPGTPLRGHCPRRGATALHGRPSPEPLRLTGRPPVPGPAISEWQVSGTSRRRAHD